MNADIFLINAPVNQTSRHAGLTPPLGIAYIASVLLNAGFNISVRDLNVSGFDSKRIEMILRRYNPKILGISTHTETYLNGLKIAEIAKQVNPEVTVVMGGPHATVLYEDVLREESVDIVVRGEGEYTMLELADCLIRNNGSLSEVKGIAYKDGGTVNTTPERPFIENPDELPFPARVLFPLPLYESPGTVLISRGGCPYNCRFCAVNSIWKGRRRYRSPKKVLEEIIQILNNDQAKEINFVDDTFTLNRERVIELCELLKNTKETSQLRWMCSTRVDLVDEELLKIMHEAGCHNIQYGIEAGSQSILDSIGKKITLNQVRDAVEMTLNTGLETHCSFMFPHPEDTEGTIREQITLMKELREKGAIESLSFTTPVPGSYYFDHADDLGIKILAKNWDEFDAKHILIATKNLDINKLDLLFKELVSDVGLKSITH